MRHLLRSRLARGWQLRSATTARIRNSLLVPGGVGGEDEHQYTNVDGRTGPQTLRWYACGPTVYDSSHIGHARTYVCTDIIRRILSDVLGHRVEFALGITDIDDKIIARAAENGSSSWADMVAFARHWEADFFADMECLGVRPPDAVLRVTEHMPEVVRYVQQLLESDKAYATEDGIYFDVSCVAEYGKLGHVPPLEQQPPSKAAVVGKSRKRSPRDFALWKFAKPGEPSCTTSAPNIAPGRPGWHIECSAMTHAHFGPHFELHSGGVDLKFPHHTNEIAQCEAHNCSTQPWVQTWLHTGHIYIQGRKMSKSLKNFTSIRDFLSSGEFGSRPATDFRIYCLQHRYSTNLHFGPERIHEAASFRHRVEHFRRLVAALRSADQAAPTSSNKPCDASRQLLALLSTSHTALLAALADDFDTPAALKVVSDLVGSATLYASDAPGPSTECLAAVDRFVVRYMGLLGVNLEAGGSSSGVGEPAAAAMGDRERQLVDTLVRLRASVRQAGLGGMQHVSKAAKAQSQPDQALVQGAFRDVMAACDDARDRATSLGIQIDDLAGSKSTWRQVEKHD